MMHSSLPPEAFSREDESPDSLFYAQPRLVYHIDDYAVAAVREAYRRFLAPGGDYGPHEQLRITLPTPLRGQPSRWPRY